MRRVGEALVLAVALGVPTVAVTRGPDHWTPAQAGLSPATVTVDLRRPVNRFVSDRALGAGVDGHGEGETAQIYSQPNLSAMRKVGLRSVSYRLRTELGVEAWHWNPQGRWSDARRHRGYWTSSDRPGRRVGATYGFRLPRRGNTIDQANDDGYSRLDDGDRRTFWKSDPYLDPHFAGHTAPPQWMLVDLGNPRAVGVLGLDWGAPFARRFRVERWVGANANFSVAPLSGRWEPFPRARFAGHRGRQRVRLGGRPVIARFVRVVLMDSSHTAVSASRDGRDRLGFSVRELTVGSGGPHSHDLVRHRPDHGQTITYASSTDPWHRAEDRDPNTEQPSFQRVLASGLTGHRPVMAPVPLLYGTPTDAAAELRYLRALHYPVGRLELGEEPDGQLATPETYGALYVQTARALHRVERHAKLGGPGFQTSIPDWYAWEDGHGSTSWTGRFLAYLRSRGALGDLAFFSFEWYPFDDVCAAPAPQLMRAPALLAGVLRAQQEAGLPRRVPRVIAEYGYSAFAGRPEVDLPGALFDAETAAQFLSLGGQVSYLYGYEPDSLIRESARCNSWGNLTLWQSDGEHRIIRPLAALHALRLLMTRWAQPGHGSASVYLASSDARGPDARTVVTAYAVRRPDRKLAVLLVNKDPAAARWVRLTATTSHGPRSLSGPGELFSLSRAQYVWHAHGEHGYALPDQPPAHAMLPHGPLTLKLPPFSLSVLQLSDRA
ncbi:MAG: discoidin domain-containing protein [Actinomycetota bacterium]|nr:discoidin domain-containing protein [Actinomycetota bacterium]